MVDPWSLRILLEVAERGSFSAAAESLVLTQPAVSRQMSGLERQLGVMLFRRVPRGVTLTTAGTTAVDLARGVLGRLDVLEATMKSFAGLDNSHLRMSGFASVNTHFVPDAIRRFHDAHPAVTVSLLQVDSLEGLAAVHSGQVDVALLTEWQLYADPMAARTDPAPVALRSADLAGVDLIPLVEEELLLAVARDHPLAAHRTVRLRDLRDEIWIEGAHPDCLGPIAQLTAAMGGSPRIGFTCDDWNGKQALVAGGSGIMLMPTLAAAAIRPDIELRPTMPRLAPRPLYIAVAEPPFRSPAAQAMAQLLQTMVPTSEPPG